MIKKTNPETGEIAEVPQSITFTVEGHGPFSALLLMNTYPTGTRGWDARGNMFINGEKVNFSCYFYVSKSKGKKAPWWWEKHISRRERKEAGEDIEL
jgi:hypothetical protein